MVGLKFVSGAGPMPIGSFVVPEELADAFLKVAGKPQNFYSGFDWQFICRGTHFLVHTSYEADLRSIGIEMPNSKAGRE